MLKKEHLTSNPHLKSFFSDTLKVWGVTSLAVVLGAVVFHNFSAGSRAATDNTPHGIKTVTYKADNSGSIMNENGDTFLQPKKSDEPSWLGTETSTHTSYLDLRLDNGSIPLNATILNANLEVYSFADQQNPVSVTIMAEKNRSPEKFDTEDPPSTRETIEKTVSYSIPETWQKDTKYTIPLTELITAWSQMPDRKKSSRIVLLIKGTDSTTSKRLIHNSRTKKSFAPHLVVTFQKNTDDGGPESTPIPTVRPTTPPSPTTVATTNVPNSPTVTTRPASPTPTTIAGGPSPTVPPSARKTGIWISPQELSQLPMSGTAWGTLKDAADSSWQTPDVSDQNSNANVEVMAGGLVYARTNDSSYRAKVMNALVHVVGTECADSSYLLKSDTDSFKPCGNNSGSARSLALGREVAAYVISADLIDLKTYNPTFDTNTFRPWLRYLLTRMNNQGTSLTTCNENRPNNWGMHCGSSRLAIALYLNDTTQVQRVAQIFKGWLGDRSSYKYTDWGDLSWQADPNNPIGINPSGSRSKDGVSIDGALPDDMRRGCSIQFPPCYTNYPWGAMEGALAQAVMLSRQGYPVWDWQDQALKRAISYLQFLETYYKPDGSDSWWAHGDDVWAVWVVNSYYGTDFPTEHVGGSPGKNISWTDWTHSVRR